jgi:hypothetical protein
MNLIMDNDAQPFSRSVSSQVEKSPPFMANEASLFTKICHWAVS